MEKLTENGKKDEKDDLSSSEIRREMALLIFSWLCMLGYYLQNCLKEEILLKFPSEITLNRVLIICR